MHHKRGETRSPQPSSALEPKNSRVDDFAAIAPNIAAPIPHASARRNRSFAPVSPKGAPMRNCPMAFSNRPIKVKALALGAGASHPLDNVELWQSPERYLISKRAEDEYARAGPSTVNQPCTTYLPGGKLASGAVIT